MKLEIKHLAPYLPYGLKVILGNTPRDLTAVSLDSRFVFVTAYIGGRDKQMAGIENIKLLLRSLSDLTKEIEINGERFVPIIKLNNDCLPDFEFNGMDFTFTFEGDMSSDGGYSFERTTQVAPNQYLLFQKLAEWHFDIFGLIEAGLAIDLNTVK